MGLFWHWKKKASTPPSASAPQVTEHKDAPVKPAQQTPVPIAPSVQQQPEPQVQPTPRPEATQPAKPHAEVEMRKVLFRFSSSEQAKCDLFIKEMLRKINKHDWHMLSGRIGKHVDGIKMRMEIKGKTEDIDALLKWCKTDHLGVHIYQVVESKAHRMPYPTHYPPFQELHGSWAVP